MGRYYEEQTMSGIKAAVVARKYGISPSYREKHGEHAVR
jgi:hypothetical protein